MEERISKIIQLTYRLYILLGRGNIPKAQSVILADYPVNSG